MWLDSVDNWQTGPLIAFEGSGKGVSRGGLYPVGFEFGGFVR